MNSISDQKLRTVEFKMIKTETVRTKIIKAGIKADKIKSEVKSGNG